MEPKPWETQPYLSVEGHTTARELMKQQMEGARGTLARTWGYSKLLVWRRVEYVLYPWSSLSLLLLEIRPLLLQSKSRPQSMSLPLRVSH